MSVDTLITEAARASRNARTYYRVEALILVLLLPLATAFGALWGAATFAREMIVEARDLWHKGERDARKLEGA